jgi:hypothetical protein
MLQAKPLTTRLPRDEGPLSLGVADQLVAANAVDALQERLAKLPQPDEVSEIVALFVRQARPWGEGVP